MSNQARALRAIAGLALVLLGLVPARFASAQDAASPARGDLSVDQAVRLALERNKDLLSFAENVEAASGFKKQALQSYLPRLSASASYTHDLNAGGRVDPNTLLPVEGDSYGVQYVLSQNILDIASLKTISAAGKDLDASKLNWKQWLGSAPDQPIKPERFFLWRWYWDFGGGALTDLMTHWIDVIQWYMGTPAPKSALATGTVYA